MRGGVQAGFTLDHVWSEGVQIHNVHLCFCDIKPKYIYIALIYMCVCVCALYVVRLLVVRREMCFLSPSYEVPGC